MMFFVISSELSLSVCSLQFLLEDCRKAVMIKFIILPLLLQLLKTCMCAVIRREKNHSHVTFMKQIHK
jgi:hypothetical protein